MTESIYWYDYETFGADPARDRPVQFAGIRTDLALNPVAPPLSLYCKPAPDYLPSPEACLITGITPQQALREGVVEAEFITAINAAFSVAGTCGAGYNSIRFDDEVTRHTLYRNLMDPYAREWRNGNSRWDLIDVMRMARALRPEGIVWPLDDETGRPVFKLERLTAANGITHAHAHDAVSDVEATIALARLLKMRQPRLFEFLFKHRGKQAAGTLLDVGAMTPVLHVSSRYPSDRHCLAVVVALAWHPDNPNGVVVYDLSVDPQPLLTLPIETLMARLYTPKADLPEGVDRVPLKTVHLNKCPALAPMNALRPEDVERLQLDLLACDRHLEALRQVAGLSGRVRAIVGAAEPRPPADPDLALYERFIPEADRRLLEGLRALPPSAMGQASPDFEDSRLSALWFRYQARNFPEALDAGALAGWEAFRQQRLSEASDQGFRTFEAFEGRIRELMAQAALSEADRTILAQLEAYGRSLRT